MFYKNLLYFPDSSDAGESALPHSDPGDSTHSPGRCVIQENDSMLIHTRCWNLHEEMCHNELKMCHSKNYSEGNVQGKEYSPPQP